MPGSGKLGLTAAELPSLKAMDSEVKKVNRSSRRNRENPERANVRVAEVEVAVREYRSRNSEEHLGADNEGSSFSIESPKFESSSATNSPMQKERRKEYN